MTNREAIKILKIERDHMTPTLFTERIEAIDMAISALRVQDLQSTCNQLATDCISRQDAVSRFSDLLMVELKGKRLPTWDEVHNAMQDVPSAQPDRSCIEQIKWERNLAIQQLNELGHSFGEAIRHDKDAISRKGAINAVCTVLYPDADKMNDAKKVLKEMPSVQPEYYDYSDIEPLWKSFAEENDINLTDTTKQLKDAMWCGYRKGKADAQSEQRWIPCSEEPDNDREVFIARGEPKFMSVCIGYYDHDYKQWYESRNWFAKCLYDGLYWCEIPPLPEPYRGE